MIVLKHFEHQFVDDSGTSSLSFGLILTSRAIFRNFERAVLNQNDQLAITTDGTCKLRFGGWTLVDCGCEALSIIMLLGAPFRALGLHVCSH